MQLHAGLDLGQVPPRLHFFLWYYHLLIPFQKRKLKPQELYFQKTKSPARGRGNSMVRLDTRYLKLLARASARVSMSDEGKLVSPVLWDKISGDLTLREIKREEEVEHERQLAMIRAESHALVWHGTAEELVTTFTRWYENGWIIADGVQSALEKASVHFRKPDGAPVIKPFLPAQVHTGTFSASPTYQKITFAGKEYNLAQHRHAPAVLKALHESLSRGESGLTTTQIRERAKLPRNGGKMYDWFRGTALWKTLVVSVGRDRYRLDLSTET